MLAGNIESMRTNLYLRLNQFSKDTDYKGFALLGRVASIPAAIVDIFLATVSRPVTALELIVYSGLEIKNCVLGNGKFKKAVLYADFAIQVGISALVSLLMFPFKLVYQIIAGICDPKHAVSFLPAKEPSQLVAKLQRDQNECYAYLERPEDRQFKRVVAPFIALPDIAIDILTPFVNFWERTCLTVMHLAGCTIREGYTVKSAIGNADGALSCLVLIPYMCDSFPYKLAYQAAMNVLYPETARPFAEWPR